MLKAGHHQAMAAWKPALKAGVDPRELPLTLEEGFIISRLDGATDLQGISVATGLSPERIAEALQKLVALGAVAQAGGIHEDEPKAAETDSPENAPEPDEDTRTHRALYEGRLRHVSVEERVAQAKICGEPELSALCFDGLPEVIHALLDNPRFGPLQARLVASHHHTSSGLDAIASRTALVADAGVRRALLRNPQAPAGLVRRLYSGRRLLELCKLAASRDVTEHTRHVARELMRKRFATAEADERVEVIIMTEGRCLAPLAGIPVDGRTTALLCGRTYASTLLVQNIAHWSAAPPALIAHLLKEEIVRRSPGLRTLLQRHPNALRSARGR